MIFAQNEEALGPPQKWEMKLCTVFSRLEGETKRGELETFGGDDGYGVADTGARDLPLSGA